MYTPLISVIVPVYNTAAYLERCIGSIRNNTYENLEIICVNDGSTDNSLDILRQYESSDKRVVVINQSNGGISVARNTGLWHAKGEFISFLDSDDWCHQRYFETMIQHQRACDADIVVVDFCAVRDGDTISEPDFASVNHRMLDRNQALYDGYASGYVWGRIYRASVLKEHFFLQNLVPREDTAYNFDILCSYEELRIAHVSLPLFYYYQRSGSLVRTGPLANLSTLAEWYLSFCEKSADPFCKTAAMDRAYKMALAYRYTSSLCTSGTTRRACSALLRACLKPIFENRSIALSRKCIYLLFHYCPGLYRAYRLHSDPSLKDWEHSVKNQK